jgi:uncharacterized protein (DUF1778 family)
MSVQCTTYDKLGYIEIAENYTNMFNAMSKVKEARIELRTTQVQKEILERAAQLKGISITAYTLSQVLPVATQEVDTYDRLTLSAPDRDLFMAALENPPELKGKLKAAILKYKDEYGI